MKDFTFIRLLVAVTGIIEILSALYFLIVAIVRGLGGPVFPRAVTLTATIVLVLGFLLQGICWLVFGLNTRIWHTRGTE